MVCAVSAAIMVGRSGFVCFAFVNLSPLGLDAVSAAMVVGRSVFVCFVPSSACRFMDLVRCRYGNE